jgi:molecular chaperone GrpE
MTVFSGAGPRKNIIQGEFSDMADERLTFPPNGDDEAFGDDAFGDQPGDPGGDENGGGPDDAWAGGPGPEEAGRGEAGIGGAWAGGAENGAGFGYSAVEDGPPPPTDWEAEAGRFQDLYLRTLAEAENVRRRFQKEREETSKFATEGVLKDLLPFLDNLNLALSYADESNPAVKNLAQGVAMTLKGCLDKLADWGLREVEVLAGGPFDPNFQEAIGQEPNPALPDKSVGRLVSKGYTLHGRLLRAARVVVVKNPEQG